MSPLLDVGADPEYPTNMMLTPPTRWRISNPCSPFVIRPFFDHGSSVNNNVCGGSSISPWTVFSPQNLKAASRSEGLLSFTVSRFNSRYIVCTLHHRSEILVPEWFSVALYCDLYHYVNTDLLNS